MIPALESCDFQDGYHGGSCAGLIKAKYRALAIMHDCQGVLPATTQIFNQLSALPDPSDMECRQASSEEWLAAAIKAIIDAAAAADADRGAQLERYAASALEHAGRILKLQQGHQEGEQAGHQKHVTEVADQRKASIKKAGEANADKGKETRQAIINCYNEVRKEKGNFHGIYKEVASRVGVTPQRVTQVIAGK